MSDSSLTVISRVFSALYAGITTATRFPLIIASPSGYVYFRLYAYELAATEFRVT
jgi:hypothetical protein